MAKIVLITGATALVAKLGCCISKRYFMPVIFKLGKKQDLTLMLCYRPIMSLNPVRLNI